MQMHNILIQTCRVRFYIAHFLSLESFDKYFEETSEYNVRTRQVLIYSSNGSFCVPGPVECLTGPRQYLEMNC